MSISQKDCELIINLAPTGLVPNRNMSPHVPLQPDEIIADVLACAEAGITSVHLHARDMRGIPTHSKEVYARIIGGIREKRSDLIICVSCTGRGGASFAQRTEVLSLDADLRPDMASLTLSSMNFSSGESINKPDTVIALAQEMQARGIKPEFEIFDLGMVNVLNYLISRGLAEPPYYGNIILGNIASAQARFLDIGCLLSALPTDMMYCLAGIGHAQFAIAGMAAAAAPGVRVGLEDNLWMDAQRTKAATNLAMIEKVHLFASLHDRSAMTPISLRHILALRNF